VVADPPPDWLLNQALKRKSSGINQATMNNWGSDFTERSLHKNGSIFINAFNHSVFLNHDCLSWAQEFITLNAKDIRITSTYPGFERCGPHIDRTRNFTLMFLIQTGGDHHETVFYKEKNTLDLVRPKGYHVDDYDKLDQIKTIVLQKNAWNLINGRILHSIEYIIDGRISIQISMDELDPNLILTDTHWYYDYN